MPEVLENVLDFLNQFYEKPTSSNVQLLRESFLAPRDPSKLPALLFTLERFLASKEMLRQELIDTLFLFNLAAPTLAPSAAAAFLSLLESAARRFPIGLRLAAFFCKQLETAPLATQALACDTMSRLARGAGLKNLFNNFLQRALPIGLLGPALAKRVPAVFMIALRTRAKPQILAKAVVASHAESDRSDPSAELVFAAFRAVVVATCGAAGAEPFFPSEQDAEARLRRSTALRTTLVREIFRVLGLGKPLPRLRALLGLPEFVEVARACVWTALFKKTVGPVVSLADHKLRVNSRVKGCSPLELNQWLVALGLGVELFEPAEVEALFEQAQQWARGLFKLSETYPTHLDGELIKLLAFARAAGTRGLGEKVAAVGEQLHGRVAKLGLSWKNERLRLEAKSRLVLEKGFTGICEKYLGLL